MKAMRRMISFVLALLLLVPAYAVISAGKDNSYGHPHAEVLSRLRAVGAKVLRTDESGTIRLYSDGENVVFRE
jgi:competence protein ComEC